MRAIARLPDTRAARPRTDRIAIGAVGTGLVLLVSAAWGTGVFYLVARLGAPSPVRLAGLDGVHVYVGLVGAVFLLAKIVRVGLRRRVRGIPGLVPWHRWVSWSLLALYATIFASGVLVLLPISGRLYSDLVEIHLMSSLWAVPPTTWHVWHYRRHATPYLGRLLPRARGRWFWLGIAVIAAPSLLVAAQPRAVSQLPEVMAGGAWTQAGLVGIPISHIATTGDGGALVAAGDGLFVSRDGTTWYRVDFPLDGGTAAAPGSRPIPSGVRGAHVHGPANASTTAVQSLAVSSRGIYVGTAPGMYFSPTLDGPLVDLGFPGQNVEAIAVDPADPAQLWATSTGGPMRSGDGGRTWRRLADGLLHPQQVAAFAYVGDRVFTSDSSGVFEWGAAGSWVRSSDQPSVVNLAAGAAGDLYASASSGDVWRLAAGRWQPLGLASTVHRHNGQLHGQLQGVVATAGRLYAAGTAGGVSASADGGRTWTELGGGISDNPPSQLISCRGSLWAATATGVFRYALAPVAAGSPRWWALVLGAAGAAGLVALVLAAIPRVRPPSAQRRPAPRPPRPFMGAEEYFANVASDQGGVVKRR